MTRGLELSPELLARQGRALRGLALSLLGDAHAAEDIVQETWLACLKRPEVLPQRVSAWLGTVTRHLALRRVRGEGRRRAREREAAAPEREEARQQRGLEREEALRAVTTALLSLEEPFKGALLLRYYDGRTPAEIAAELEVPLATVKSRLARGLERLRVRLGREFADDGSRRMRALLALAGVSAPELALGGTVAGGMAGGTATIGVLGMGVKLQATAVALALLGGALWWWNRDPRAAGGAVQGGAAAGAGVRAAGLGVADAALLPGTEPADAPAQAQREAVALAAAATEQRALFAPEAAFPYRISGRVRDELDQPLPGASVYFGPHAFALNRAAETDGAGRFAFAFDGRRASLDGALTVADRDGRTLGLVEVRLRAGQELVVDLGLSSPLRSVVTRGQGDAEAGLEIRLGFTRFMHVLGTASGPLEGAPEMLRAADGRSLFVDPAPAQQCARDERPPPQGSATDQAEEYTIGVGRALLLDMNGSLLHGQLELGGESITYRLLTPAGEEAGEAADLPGSVEGLLRSPDGRALAHVVVGWARPGERYQNSVSTDAEGRYLLEGLPAGEIELRAGGGDHGRAQERIVLQPGQRLVWNPLLERGDELVGRVVLPSGDGLAACRLELWSVNPGQLWCDTTLSNEDGRFAFPNVPVGALELHVYATGSVTPAQVLPVRVLRPVFARSDVGEIVLAPRDLVSHEIAVAPSDQDGVPLAPCELRVWQVASGRGVLVNAADEQGVLRLAGLPQGQYRVEAGGPQGWRELGRVWLEEDLDLGRERFAALGLAEVELAAPPGGADVALTVWSAQADVFAQVGSREPLEHAIFALRPGAYVVCAEAGAGERVEAPLAVRSAHSSGLLLEVGAAGTLSPRAGAPALAARRADLAAELASASCSACHAGDPGF